MYQCAQSDSSNTVYKQQRNKATHMPCKAPEAYKRDLVASSKRNSNKCSRMCKATKDSKTKYPSSNIVLATLLNLS